MGGGHGGPVTDVDATAADMLMRMASDLEERGVLLRFAEVKGHVRDRLQAYGIVDRIGASAFYPIVGQPVRS